MAVQQSQCALQTGAINNIDFASNIKHIHISRQGMDKGLVEVFVGRDRVHLSYSLMVCMSLIRL